MSAYTLVISDQGAVIFYKDQEFIQQIFCATPLELTHFLSTHSVKRVKAIFDFQHQQVVRLPLQGMKWMDRRQYIKNYLAFQFPAKSWMTHHRLTPAASIVSVFPAPCQIEKWGKSLYEAHIRDIKTYSLPLILGNICGLMPEKRSQEESGWHVLLTDFPSPRLTLFLNNEFMLSRMLSLPTVQSIQEDLIWINQYIQNQRPGAQMSLWIWGEFPIPPAYTPFIKESNISLKEERQRWLLPLSGQFKMGPPPWALPEGPQFRGRSLFKFIMGINFGLMLILLFNMYSLYKLPAPVNNANAQSLSSGAHNAPVRKNLMPLSTSL